MPAARSRPDSLVALAALIALAALAPGARADGFVVLRPQPEAPRPEALAVQYHDVRITVRDQVAQVTIDQVFRNPNGRRVEGDYIFPIPDGAAVSDFVLHVDGRPVHAEALDAQQALRVYQELVRESRDPALLEYAGRELFRARIHPFEPFGERRVALSYEQVVEREGGIYRLVYPLSTEKFSSRPLERAVVTIELDADRPIRNAYCPSHAVAIEQLDRRRLRVSWEEHDTLPDRDLVCYYALAEGALDLRVVPHRPVAGEDGYFMLLAAPGLEEELPVVPKDVVFVVDRSGSMQGTKIEQARRALRHCLDHLDARDRFNVISFASDVTACAPDLQPANHRSLRAAQRCVDDLAAAGSTNISGALAEALDQNFDGERPAFVVFITDGLPTVGESDPERILAQIIGRGRAPRIFTFGVGHDVNAVLLDLLAEETAGRPAYVRPGEDLETRVSGFYHQIAEPVLTDIAIELEGARLRDPLPARAPDIFRGGQLVLFGRYAGDGPARVELTGTVGGRRRTFTAEIALPVRETRNDFIGRLWATRKVGALLRAVRLHGEQDELVDEIRDLGVRFGIATPYTSLLVDESGPEPRMVGTGTHFADPGGGSSWGGIRGLYGGSREERGRKLATPSGELGVALSSAVEALVSATAAPETDAGSGARYAAGRSFRLDGVTWCEAGFAPGTPTAAIDPTGEDCFGLLRRHPELGPVLALGPHVIFRVDGRWFETRPGATGGGRFQDSGAMR